MQFVWFLGRLHVLLVHLPLGILTLAVALEILVRFRPFRSLETAVAPAWIAGAISALATVALGFMHATEANFEDMPAVETHQWAGVALAAVACLTAILRMRMPALYPPPQAATQAGGDREGAPRWAGPEKVARLYNAVQPVFARGAALDRGYDKLWGVPVAAILVLMFLTGHLGGSLTHGDTYLVQYAPGPFWPKAQARGPGFRGHLSGRSATGLRSALPELPQQFQEVRWPVDGHLRDIDEGRLQGPDD
jgi:hypothetical protein